MIWKFSVSDLDIAFPKILKKFWKNYVKMFTRSLNYSTYIEFETSYLHIQNGFYNKHFLGVFPRFFRKTLF